MADADGHVVKAGVVAVTGASGFIGSHVTLELLRKGYTVRATVRDPKKEASTAHIIAAAKEMGASDRLSFARGNLLEKGAYDDAFAGVDAVVHCAAVVSNKNQVKDPIKEIVDPSVVGTENVLASVAKAGTVRRVVHTSSIAAIQTYDKPKGYVFSEKDFNDWSGPKNGDFYGMAKMQAERVAAKASKESANKGGYDAVFINPGMVFGPVLTKAHTKGSAVFMRQILFGNAQPDFCTNYVDVRDVAAAHVLALQKEEFSGERFVLTGDTKTHCMRFPQLQQEMAALFPDRKIPKAKLHSGVLYNIAWYLKLSEFEKKAISTDIAYDNTKSKKMLGVRYTKGEDTLRDTVTTMTPFLGGKK